MARPLRIEYSGAWYHVTCRGNERRAIFQDSHDREKFLKILGANRGFFGVHVHAYVLMVNHFHLLVETSQANLHKFMQRFNTTYTVYYNRRHRRSGHLYQGRYKAILIEADSYLLQLSRYLHWNPVRIRKYSELDVEKKVKILRSYPWSSYRGYVQVRYRQPFLTYSRVLEMVGGRDDQVGRKRYARFVLGGVLDDMNITFWDGVRGQVVLGSDNFMNWVYERFLSRRRVEKKEFPRFRELRRGPERMEEIARRVALEFKVPETGLYLRRFPVRVARSVFMELCCSYLTRGLSLVEIGRRLGGVSVSALSQNRNRLMAVMEEDVRLRRRFEKLREVLESST